MAIHVTTLLNTTGNADPTHVATVATALEAVSLIMTAVHVDLTEFNVVRWTITSEADPMIPAPTWRDYIMPILREHGYITTGTLDGLGL